MQTKQVYLDHAATTYVKSEVFEAMQPYFSDIFGNPSSIHAFARQAKQGIDHAREQVAKALNAAKVNEVYFTSGGSESDNWAIKGVAEAQAKKGKHIITTQIEHHAVLHTCEYLEKHGYEITYLPVDEQGFVTPEQVEQAIRPDTILVSIMFANNEIGTIQPIEQIGRVCHEKGVTFHTDAVQAFGSVPIDVQAMHIDLLSLSGHKIYGPKGVGALYIRNGVKVAQFLHGGAQERGRRATTENVPGIVGLGKAAEMAHEHMAEDQDRLCRMRNRLVERVLATIPYTRYNGPQDGVRRLSNNANFCFRYIEGEALLLMLDRQGIAGSSGSACTSGSLDPSHVLLAIGLPHEIAHGSLRLTLGARTTEEDIDYVLEKLPPIVQRLREMSPLYDEVTKKENR